MRLGLVLLAVVAACDDNFAGPCGNGHHDPFEECDDGNLEAGDLCSPNCTREPSCGDRVIDRGENCDDGNTVPGDNCDEKCQTETVCGDLDIEPGETCEDGNVDPSDGCSERCRVEYKVNSKVAWQFVTAADAMTQGCPAGFDTVEITTQALRDDETPAHAPVVDRLPCADGMRWKLWFIGRYRVTVRVTDTTGAPTFATFSEVIDLRGVQREVLAQYILDGGFARFDWRLVDVATGQPASCMDLNADTIGVLAMSPTFSRSHFVSCEAGHGRTQALPADDYTLTLTAIHSGSLSTNLGSVSIPVTITAPSSVVDVGTVDVALD